MKGLRFHDLRHPCITKLAENEVPDQTLMAIAGYVRKAMLEHNSHIRLAAKRAAVDAPDTFKPPSTATPEINADNPPMVN